MEEKLKDNNPKIEKESDLTEKVKRWNPEPSEKAKSLTLIEASEIFEVFRHWYYPCGTLLEKVFFPSGVPEDFLPYPKDIISSTLEMMAKHYFDIKDYKTSKNIQEVQSAIWFGYLPTEEAWLNFAELLSSGRPKIPKEKMIELKCHTGEAFNKDYIEWLRKKGEIK
jgi:hypothetical protein